MKILLLFFIGCFQFSSTLLFAQNQQINVENLTQAYVMQFQGHSINELLNRINQNYLNYGFEQEPPGRLSKVSFRYRYNDTTVATIGIKIRDYKHIIPYDPEMHFWDIDRVRQEEISEVQLSFGKYIEESIELLNAMNKFNELRMKDPETFKAVILIFKKFGQKTDSLQKELPTE